MFSSVVYKKIGHKGSPIIPIPYCFMEPVSVKIKNKDGLISSIRYGIGDKIKVLEPRFQLLIALSEFYKEIPLEDGSFIVEFPKDMKVLKEEYSQ